jgi:Uncharacterized protein conserved in bacteria
MKKIVYLFLIYIFLLTGCGSLASEQMSSTITDKSTVVQSDSIEPDKSDVKIPDSARNCSPLCKDGDIEENINGGSLNEDNSMTGANIETAAPSGQANGNGELQTTPAVSDNKSTDFNTLIPTDLLVNLKYNKYKVDKDYLIVISNGANIREAPNMASKSLKTAVYLERFGLAAAVKGERLEKYKSDVWYKVYWDNGDTKIYGYINSALTEPRKFQFGKMMDAAYSLKKEIDSHITGYIANYKDRNGKAPAWNGQNEDRYGTLRYQSAPVYLKASPASDFRYITDGSLVFILAETDSYYKIRTLNFTGEYYVPKRYVVFGQTTMSLKKTVVVDRKNQNEGVFEFNNGKLTLVSYIYATTGETSQYKQATELGYYMAIQKAGKFNYLDDVTRNVAGYAPYAIRFNGGAYIHGVPVDYKVKNGTLVDPGKQEFLFTIGTVPRSHKCVRNYTSHALFLYNWIEIGSSAVIVIE